MLFRVAMVAAALATCAWFALGVLQARDVDRASAIVASTAHLSPAQAARAHSLLRDAETLDPDSQVDLLRAQVDLSRGERGEALRIVRSVTAREPQNLTAWVALERAAPDLRTFYVAAYHILILAPKVR